MTLCLTYRSPEGAPSRSRRQFFYRTSTDPVYRQRVRGFCTHKNLRENQAFGGGPPLNQSQSRSQSHLSLFKSNGSSSFHSNSQFKRVGAMVSDSNTPTRRKVEVVYNPEERINKLADEVDKEAPLSRLTLFSPCKVITFHCFEFKF
nr:4-diphosphocytidyl-2-c-methyl-d-erythritol kinase, chloroplastic/chromoplastic [Quercus suber]